MRHYVAIALTPSSRVCKSAAPTVGPTILTVLQPCRGVALVREVARLPCLPCPASALDLPTHWQLRPRQVHSHPLLPPARPPAWCYLLRRRVWGHRRPQPAHGWQSRGCSSTSWATCRRGPAPPSGQTGCVM